ncbi:MAG: chemotaxis protein CheW [Symploca sp. SIO1A3]|nr:chemotaxis protein CheW [Symploca sp. SIO2C1]NER45867.1 chemotaxis protein CheW [Symploca sp. SIO1A3]
MAVFSPLTSRRRSTTRNARATQQLIVFRLENEGFALPIRTVQKVIPMGQVYGASEGAGVSLTLYQDQELIVIDVKRRIFREAPKQYLSGGSLSPQSTKQLKGVAERYLLIVQDSQGKLVGLPIDAPPSLQRVPESAFSPLTSDYINEGNIRCVSALIILNNDEPPLFLLNPNQLIHSLQALPPRVNLQSSG